MAHGRLESNGWQVSSYCAGSGCVEVQRGDEVRVRDAKTTASPVLTFDRDEWRAFVAGVKAGEFDV
ncbi:DUF397 domain-containing protein [Spongisporangium articulatum]|uniref:DUF397 domain-containing protein n=1 Tax=Spongisporangium articulatum TaxID=3362603 RepID=A0ABW8AJF3_9ACTN